MLIHRTNVPGLGDVEVKTIPGAAPVVSLNGVIQQHGSYSISGQFVSFNIPQKVNWQSWFAWHPVCIKGKWYWFTLVYRRKKGALFNRYDSWIYGDDFDRLKDY
jgi:hypothetical protein